MNLIKNITIKNSYEVVIRRYRLATSNLRSLPNFIVIGAQRSGTTSLFSYLSQHPQILPSSYKELSFFDGSSSSKVDRYENGSQWYRAQFPLKRRLNGNKITGEASTMYLYHPMAASRIAGLVPEVKLIAMLRNPTERAISSYFYEKNTQKRENLPIMEAFQRESERMKEAIQNKNYKDKNFIFFSYKKRGLYEEQLKRYLQFFPKHQLLVLNSESFFNEPDDTLKVIFEFLGIDNNYKINTKKALNSSIRDKTQVAPEVYEYLDRYFYRHNQALYNLIGKKYNW